jgi:carbon storage regulator CsrA
MLVLSRKVGESIVIGEGAAAARVTVMSNWGGKIRLGVVTGDDVSVDREEVRQRKLTEGPRGPRRPDPESPHRAA